jgi:PAS domain S-box-containing protein
MFDRPVEAHPELRVELDRLILRRTRVTLVLGLAAVAAFTAVNHLALQRPPLWTDAMNSAVAVSIGVALMAFKLPFVERRPVPFALLVFAVGCGVRALAGVWHGDVAPTAILLVTLALTTAATLPWGVLAQAAVALIAAAAIALNSYLVDGSFGPAPGHAAATVILGLAVSLVLAVELQRYRLQLLLDSLRRRQAETRLAKLNAELEERVTQRTAELASAMRRLEREVHDHRQAVEEARASQLRLEQVLDHAMAGIYLKDAEGRYLLVNPYWEALTGLCAENVIGKKIEEVMPSDVAAVLQANDRQVLASGRSMQFEEFIPQADGVHTYVSVKFAQFDRDGVPVGVWGLSTDVTERKRAEEQARQHQAELAHVLRLGTMGEMAAELAHEINQPLGAVSNYSQGAARRLRQNSIGAADLLPILEAITHEALRAGEIIRRLRTLVRKEPGEQKPVDLNGLVEDSVRFVDGEARLHGIHVRLDLAPGLPAIVCNGVQIEQVVLNLLRNALDAVQAGANGGGNVGVATARVGPDRVEVWVCDDGVGLPQPPADVFAPFYSTKANGLGMGLSISRSIIEAHRGGLWATRNTDRGSTLHFTLPIGGVGEAAKHADHADWHPVPAAGAGGS